MSSDKDMLLAKTKLPEGWIDLGLGEAIVVREALRSNLTLDFLDLSTIDYKYTSPEGLEALQTHLQNKHKTGKVIVTNGAKQALWVILQSLKTQGRSWVYAPVPYWVSFKRIIEMSGLTLLTREEALEKEPGTGIFLMTMPNNPNGCTDYREEQIFVDRGEYVLHDAAYWSPVYGVGSGVELPLAHGRVYSYSKAMGLSGIRLGYALVGENLYGACKEAMEASTSGASVLSQQLVLSLLEEMEEDPRKKTMFECQALATITLSRKLFLDRIKGSSVSTKSSIDLAEQGKGMFLWLEKGWGYNPDKARVRTIDGENFGDSTHFRVSLGGKTSDILEAANRLVEACFGTETQET